MEKTLQTFSFAAILVILAITFIGISWLLTGKQKIKKGMCRKNPNEKMNENCSTKSHCELCDQNPTEPNQQTSENFDEKQ